MAKIILFPATNANRELAIEQALIQAAQRYFDDCRGKIPSFIDRHFTLPGAIATNRLALGWDLLRAPLNLFWAPVYALVAVLRLLLRISGSQQGFCYQWLGRLPTGLVTDVQRHISDLIMIDILSQPAGHNPLENYLLEELQPLIRSDADHSQCQELDEIDGIFQSLIRDALNQYQVTRTASSDITNSLSCTALGAFAFQKFTPGGIGIAALVTSMVAKGLASRDFIFGSSLGNLYYGVFPPQPSLTLSLTVLAAVLAMLAAFAALSGMISDPLQAVTGLHRRRLSKMLDHMQQDFNNKGRGGFRPKDQFVARIMDGLDLIKSGLL